jgi:CheY-like chemotaxis protein
VLLAFDGEAALAVAREQLPDVVVLDLAMPRLDGLATARRLRADARTASIPLVLFSAHVGLEVEAAARAAGFDVVVRKPGPLSRLVAAVVGLLQGPTDDTVAVVDVLAAVVGP